MESEYRIWGYGTAFSEIWRENLTGSVPFYPLWYNQFLNRKLPVIIDTNNLALVVKSIPVLESVINRKALMLKNARFKMYKMDKNGNADLDQEIYGHRTLKLLHTPNVLQKTTDFLAQWSWMRSVYANDLVYKNKPGIKSYPSSIWNLPMGEMKIIPTGKLFQQNKIEDIIEEYVHINNQYPNASPKNYLPNEIMNYVDGVMDQYYFGTSKLLINKVIISNLQIAYNTRNVLLHDRGAMGILSSDSGDESGGIPLGEDERQKVEKDFHRKYGLRDDQMSVLITNTNLKWQPMSFPTKELMIFEEVEDDFCQLCNLFGLQRSIFADATVSKGTDSIGGDGKGKVEEGMKITYQTTLQQEIDEFCDGINRDMDFQHDIDRVVLVGSFDHLPCMQEDQVDAENVKNVKAQADSTLSTAILALNSQVSGGTLQLDAALAILENIFGISPKIGATIILAPVKPIDPEADDEEEKQKKELAQKLKFKLL